MLVPLLFYQRQEQKMYLLSVKFLFGISSFEIITARTNDTGLTANYETHAFIRTCEVEQPRLFRVRVANYT